ncbi:hypothetical protein GS682_30790 [Nostoc sp. B(2019)]|nr:hypothetical protein [Nostoc sp. B(2019)]
MATPHHSPTDIWLPLPVAVWRDTYETLHLWTQIVGKIRLALAPKINHWWHSTLYVTPRGLTTSTIPYGTRNFQITFNFLLHQLLIETSDGTVRIIELTQRSVSNFYQTVINTLKEIGIEVRIWTMPQEVVDPIPFEQDEKHSTYNREYAQRFWQILVQAERILTRFRSSYVGKCSPVHFFWGSFDLAVTRFSGQPAPKHPGGVPNMADWVTREAYSHEVSSCGFWFGGGSVEALFYAYAYPEPEGFKDYSIQPHSAFYSLDMKEFILPYEAVRQANDPDAMALVFLQSAYEAVANLAQWDRTALEYNPVVS